VVGATDRQRVDRRRHPHQPGHGRAVADPAGHQPAPRPGPKRGGQPRPGHGHRPLSRAHDPRRCEEGRANPDGGGWPAHGRDSDAHRAAGRAKTKGAKAGYVYLHSAVDGFSRLAYTEPLANETAKTAIGFFARARAFFAAHRIARITRVITDNGACYRAAAFTRSLYDAARHQPTRRSPRDTTATSKRYQRILAEELLYARTWTSEAQRAEAIRTWAVHYDLTPATHRRREPTTRLTPPHRRH
jgi:hypothetical protein